MTQRLDKSSPPKIVVARDRNCAISYETRSLLMHKLVELSLAFHSGMPLIQFKALALKIEDIMAAHCASSTTYKLSCGQLLAQYRALKNVHKLEAFAREHFASEKYPRAVKAQTPLQRLLLTENQLRQNGYPTSLDCEHNDGDFVEVPARRKNNKKRYSLLAIDCEMCRTAKGSELTRISIVDSKLMVVYDKLVRPKNAIVDYLTRWSGITPALMDGVTRTVEDVHADIFEFMDSETILCGHSLENDVIAMKVVHRRVVDTAVLFMKRMKFRNKRRGIGFVPGCGGGRKISLKALCAQYLNKNIQSSKGPDGQIVGHSSVEDAIAAMQLLQLQLKWEEERNRKLGIAVPKSIGAAAETQTEAEADESVVAKKSTTTPTSTTRN